MVLSKTEEKRIRITWSPTMRFVSRSVAISFSRTRVNDKRVVCERCKSRFTSKACTINLIRLITKSTPCRCRKTKCIRKKSMGANFLDNTYISVCVSMIPTSQKEDVMNGSGSKHIKKQFARFYIPLAIDFCPRTKIVLANILQFPILLKCGVTNGPSQLVQFNHRIRLYTPV